VIEKKMKYINSSYYFLDQKEKETLRAKIANGIFIGPQVTEMNITLSGSTP